MHRRTAPIVAGFALVLVLGACRVDATVAVRVREDGSGRVTARVALDAGAVRAAEVGGGKLEERVRLADLAAAGWRSSGWVRGQGGGATLTIRKPFGRPQDAAGLVAELSGPDGPLRSVRVRRDTSTFRTRWAFSGVAARSDLRTGIARDPALAASLAAAGVDAAALDRRLLAQVRDTVRLRVTAELPHASPRTYRVEPGTRVVLRTSSSAFHRDRVVWLTVGIGAGGLALALLLWGEWRVARRRRWRPGPARRSGRPPGRRPGRTGPIRA